MTFMKAFHYIDGADTTRIPSLFSGRRTFYTNAVANAENDRYPSIQFVFPKRGCIARGICCLAARSKFLAGKIGFGMKIVNTFARPHIPDISLTLAASAQPWTSNR